MAVNEKAVSFTEVYLEAERLAQRHNLYNLGYTCSRPPFFHIGAASYGGWTVAIKTIDKKKKIDDHNVLIDVGFAETRKQNKVAMGGLRDALEAAVAPEAINALRNQDIEQKKQDRERKRDREKAEQHSREQQYAERRDAKDHEETGRWAGEQRFVLFGP